MVERKQVEKPYVWDPRSSGRDLTREYLARTHPTVNQTLEFITSYHHISTERDSMEEPGDALAKIIETTPHRPRVKRLMAQRLAPVLERLVDPKPMARDKKDAGLFNGLRLACVLSQPIFLAESVSRVWQARPEGEWRGRHHGWSLSVAMITNQIDRRYESIWKQLLSRDRNDYLGANCYDGLTGLLRMPAEVGKLDYPDMDVIGEALATLIAAKLWERDSLNTSDPRAKDIWLSSRIEHILRTYPNLPTLPDDLLTQGRLHHFPDWAMTHLWYSAQRKIDIASSFNQRHQKRLKGERKWRWTIALQLKDQQSEQIVQGMVKDKLIDQTFSLKGQERMMRLRGLDKDNWIRVRERFQKAGINYWELKQPWED